MRECPTGAGERPRLRGWLGAALCGGLLGLVVLAPATGQQVHQNGFYGPRTAWLRGEDNVRAEERVHELTDHFAHSLPTSERIQLVAPPAPADPAYAYYYYPTDPAPVSDELSASLWVKASKAGVRLEARLVLPRERNPQRPDEPMTVSLQGDVYKQVGRWQRMELPRPVKLMGDRRQQLRIQLQREIDFTDAYIDRLVLNLFTGPGPIDVFIDDLEVGPVRGGPAAPPPAAPGKAVPARPTGQGPAAPPVVRNERGIAVKLEGDRLLVGGRPIFFRAVRYSDTPLKALRDAGFNAVWFDTDTPAATIEEAIGHGFWIIPSLPLVGDRATASGGRPNADLVSRNGAPDLANARDADELALAVRRFRSGDGVLFWDLGGARSAEQVEQVARTAAIVREADPRRPRGADVWDGFSGYSLNVELVGTHRCPLMTSLELSNYRDWLSQRRHLTKFGNFMWTWVQTHVPDWEAKLLYGRDTSRGFDEPIGPQPEQIRLLTYLALASGCRGLGFWSDRFLADSHQGRDRLLMMALLNQEIHMLEPILLSVNSAEAQWLDTSDGRVKAAVLRSDKGILVLPIWMGSGSQYVPPQGAIANLRVTIPLVPDATQPWEISPGRVQSLQRYCKRVLAGTEVTLPEFDLTAAIVFTSDLSRDGLVVRWQDHSRRIAKTAAQWGIDLAAVEIQKVAKVQAQLARLAPEVSDAELLLREAERRLANARALERADDDGPACQEALRALRPLRILMRAHWDLAVKTLDLPSCSPYAVSFFTLPRHWQLFRQVQASRAGYNLVRDGDFEGVRFTTDDPEVVQAAATTAPGSTDRFAPGAFDPKARPGTPGAADPKARPGAPGTLPKKVPWAPVSALPGWTVQQMTLDQVVMEAKLVSSEFAEDKEVPKPKRLKDPYQATSPARRPDPDPKPPVPKLGKGCLRLEIKAKPNLFTPKGKPIPPPPALERTFLAVSTPPVRLPPGTLVRVSAWMRVPNGVAATADGALLYDSVGGEALAIRITGGQRWRQFHLYRKVPPSGVVWVTMALTGIGIADFDDVRIEPLTPAAAPAGPTGPVTSSSPYTASRPTGR